jgi:hypothetical protein
MGPTIYSRLSSYVNQKGSFDRGLPYLVLFFKNETMPDKSGVFCHFVLPNINFCPKRIKMPENGNIEAL